MSSLRDGQTCVFFAELLRQIPCFEIYIGIKSEAVQPRLGMAALL
jgi:hypothetical protein